MVKDKIILTGAKIIFRNFAGKEGNYNPSGRRTFNVLLDTNIEYGNADDGYVDVSENDVADILERDGWNIRRLRPLEDEDVGTAHLQVTVSFNNYPPKILLISSGGKTLLDEASVSILDRAEIANADLTIRPYNWEVNGKSGVKAYLEAMYVTIEEDRHAEKYRDLPMRHDG